MFRLAAMLGAMLALLSAAALAKEREVVKIGVLAFRGIEGTLRNWQPTADYLEAAIAGHDFVVVPLDFAGLRQAVAGGDLAFVLTNAGNYVDLEAHHGISRIATLRSTVYPEYGSQFGAVIFTRAERRDIATLRDLAGKSFAAVSVEAFGGFQMAWRELKAVGVDPFTDLAALRFVGFPQDNIVRAVLDGTADAGTVRTGILEAMSTEGQIDLSALKVIDRRLVPGFGQLLSTRLYPEWAFAKMPQTSPALAQAVAIALLRLDPDHAAARIGAYAGWTVPLDYQPVHDLFRELGIGPYARAPEPGLVVFAAKYWPWLAASLGILLLVVGHSVRAEYLVARRTRELKRANAELKREIGERHEAEEKARRHRAELAHVGRVSAIGEMASALAHELNQPLAAIAAYARGSVRRMRLSDKQDDELLIVLDEVAAQAHRAGQIVSRIRGFVRKELPRLAPIDINRAVRDVADLLTPDAREHGISLQLALTDGLPPVAADLIEVEQVVVNLARNAIEAMSAGAAQSATGRRELVIRTAAPGPGFVEVSVGDNGPGIAPGDAARMFDSFYTTKPGGLGLGLAICHSIVESYGGKITARPRDDGGTLVAFSLPVARGAGA